ncbi:hypothetical protein IPM65_06465 [Candidatus Roizmanbacteria bacterium]|nr:MAG: hypothetical protein IPM65_06465 [Candidatus Roizmanbacteria bacterium]
MCNSKEIAIFGNGPGSISSADALTNSGHRVTRIVPDTPQGNSRSIYSTSTGIYRDVMDTYCPPEYRKPLPTMRIYTVNGTDFSVETGTDYFMVNYPKLTEDANARLNGKESITVESYSSNELRHVKVRENQNGVEVTIDGGRRQFDAAIDSTGAGRSIMAHVAPEVAKRDKIAEYVYAGQYPGTLAQDEMILVWDKTGATSWINPSIYTGPNGEPLLDIVYSAWGWESFFPQFLNEADTRLRHLVDFAETIPGLQLIDNHPIELTAGKILSEGLYKPDTQHVYAVGEAAGVAKPKSGESFNRTLLSGVVTAEAIDQNHTPLQVHDRLKQFWPNDYQFLAFTLARLREQHTGNTSKLMDTMGNWFKNGSVDQEFIKQMEDYIIKGSISPALLQRFVTNPVFLQTVVHTMLTYARIKVFGMSSFPRKWTLGNVPQQAPAYSS